MPDHFQSPARKMGCARCGWRGLKSQVLKAPHPFAKRQIQGCPQCGEEKHLQDVCYAAGCQTLTTMSVHPSPGPCCDHHYRELPYDFY